MGIKKHLQNNKESLGYGEDLTPVWDQLAKDLPEPKKNNIAKVFLAPFLLMLVLVCAIYFLTQKNSKETIESNNAMYAAEEPTSTSEKIIAIQNVMLKENLDEEIASALVMSLKEDESVNVKMAAAKGLKAYMGMESVRIAVIEELENSTNTYLKIKLIALLKNAKVEESLPALDKIIKEKKGFLKEEALEGRERILTI